MNLKRTSMMTLALSFALAGTAFAGEDGGRECKGKKGDRSAHLMKMDANQDGRLTKDELNDAQRTRIDRMFATADTNHDGLLAKDELEASAKARWAEKKGESTSEHKDRRGHGKRGDHAGKRFAKLDADGDGLLSRAEMEQGLAKKATRIFERLDVNQDGAIEQAELANAKRPRHHK